MLPVTKASAKRFCCRLLLSDDCPNPQNLSTKIPIENLIKKAIELHITEFRKLMNTQTKRLFDCIMN